MWNALPVALTLNPTVSPALAVEDVANPCSAGSPEPSTRQSDCGVPGRLFSHATTFTTGGSHGPAADTGADPADHRARWTRR